MYRCLASMMYVILACQDDDDDNDCDDDNEDEDDDTHLPATMMMTVLGPMKVEVRRKI